MPRFVKIGEWWIVNLNQITKITQCASVDKNYLRFGMPQGVADIDLHYKSQQEATAALKKWEEMLCETKEDDET